MNLTFPFATFQQETEAAQFNIVVSGADANGTIDPGNGSHSYDPGDSVTVYVVANVGCQIDSVKVDGVEYGAAELRTNGFLNLDVPFSDIQANHTVEAIFIAIPAKPESYANSADYTSTDTFANDDYRWVKVETWGKGGDGGGNNEFWNSGGGGGGYAMTEKFIRKNDTLSIAIGAGVASVASEAYLDAEFVKASFGEDGAIAAPVAGGDGLIGDVLISGGPGSIDTYAGGDAGGGGGTGGAGIETISGARWGGGGGGGPGYDGTAASEEAPGIGGDSVVRVSW